VRQGQLVANAVRLHADLGAVLPSFRSAPRQALARLHVLAAADLGVPADHLGRPRVDPADAVDDPLGLGEPPVPMEVSARLDGLCALLLAPTTAPAVVVAAVVHGELLALRAFGSADGLVARAAARLVLVDRGLDPKAVSAPEVGHAELDAAGLRSAHTHAYADAARGYVHEGVGGVARWIVHCAQAIALGAREGLAVCEAILRAG
jgi:hypothetical protein